MIVRGRQVDLPDGGKVFVGQAPGLRGSYVRLESPDGDTTMLMLSGPAGWALSDLLQGRQAGQMHEYGIRLADETADTTAVVELKNPAGAG